jgi:hypothetical protein
VGGRSRGRYAAPADFLRHDGAPYRGLRARRWGLGFDHRSRAILCRAVPNLNVTIRKFCIDCVRAASTRWRRHDARSVTSTAERMRSQRLKCSISLCTNPVSIFKCPYSNRPLKPLTALIGLTQYLFSGTYDRKIPLSIILVHASAIDLYTRTFITSCSSPAPSSCGLPPPSSRSSPAHQSPSSPTLPPPSSPTWPPLAAWRHREGDGEGEGEGGGARHSEGDTVGETL